MGDVFQPFEMLGPEGVQAEIKKTGTRFSPLNLGTLLRCCVLGQSTSPSNTSIESGGNEYLVGQRWQCVR